MTFLQPFILWGLPLILLPVLIHLLNRMRHRPQPWAAMQFLISATRSSVNNARLRQWLILLLRVLAVLMLVLFLSRPLAGGWLGWALSPAPDTILILLDRSASMETAVGGGRATRRQEAVRSLARAAQDFEQSSHLVFIDSASRLPQNLRQASVLRELVAAGATDTAADIPGLLAAAFNWLVDNRAGTAEIWLASDLQKSNWQPDDPRWSSLVAQFQALPQKVQFRLLTFEHGQEMNRAVALQELIRRPRIKESELVFAVDIQTSERRTETIPLTLNWNGTRTEKELRLESQALRWRNRLKLANESGSGWGSFELPADANTRDNVAYFVYGEEVPLRASVITAEANGGRLLQLAITSGGGGVTPVAPVIRPADLSRAVWEDNTLLVWQESLPDGAMAQRLRTFVAEGGTVLFLPSGRSESQRFEGLTWGPVEAAPPERPFRILRWNEEEGPLAKSDEGLSLPLFDTVFQHRQQIVGAKGALAAFEDGSAFLVRASLGRGEIVFCGSLPERGWSNLGEGPVLVPMMQRLLQSGSRRLNRVVSVHCGELSSVDQSRQWQALDSPVPKDIATQAGVYRSGDRLLAVNRPASEDDPEIVDQAEVKRLLGSLPFHLLQEQRSQSRSLEGEVWRMFAFGMLLLLLVEGVLILPAKSAAHAENGLSAPFHAGAASGGAQA